MQLEAWRNVTTGEVRFTYNVSPSFFFEGEWVKLGNVNVIPAGPVLSSMEIHDDPTDAQGSNAED